MRASVKRTAYPFCLSEENGVAILRCSLESPAPYLLMDELGRLESEAERFTAQVIACLNSNKRVLGVLQACDAPLVRAVCAREDVSVLEITPGNREGMLTLLCRALLAIELGLSG